MNDADRLLTYITAARERGVEDDFLVALLRQNGWSERSVYRAFSAYYETRLGVPLPTRGGRTEYAGDAFLYLLAFISLGCWTTAAGNLFFTLIDRWFPNALNAAYVAQSFRSSVTVQLATIIVAAPIFYFVSRSIVRGLQVRPDGADSGIRKWLTYIALVVAAVIMLSDAILFLAAFLQGDLTPAFVLKVLVLLAIAGGIFAYYFSAVRGPAVSRERDLFFGGAAAVVVAASLVLGFFIVGSPAHGRQVAADQRRVTDIKAVAQLIHEYRPQGNTLPRNLDGFGSNLTAAPHYDPITSKPYEYRYLGGTSYELCATFDTRNDDTTFGIFVHPAGRACFKLDANQGYY
jgi:hypothetical protein